MLQQCHISSLTGCTVCPYIPPTPGESAHLEVSNVIGWNAGASSVLELNGDLHVVFSVKRPVLGIVLGFRLPARTPLGLNVRPEFIQHGLYFTMVSGLPFFAVREYGAQVGSNMSWTDENDVFEIRRESGLVSYLKNSAFVYRSLVPSSGAVMVNACLYGSGDAVL